MKLALSVVIFLILLFSFTNISKVYASVDEGYIDPKYQHAWSENVGWISFFPDGKAKQVRIYDDKLTGYAWSENTGWISLNCSNDNSCSYNDYGVTNNSEGVLGGYAWGENIGWINFSPEKEGVEINEYGVFTGAAWGENIGWIIFDCAKTDSCSNNNFKVATDWRPLRIRDGIVDIVAPAFALTSIGNIKYNSNQNNYKTNETAPIFYGTAEKYSLVELWINNKNTNLNARADINGNWKIQSSNLDEGKYTVQLVAKDYSDNQTILSFELEVISSEMLTEDTQESLPDEQDIASEIQGNDLTVRLVDKKTENPLKGIPVTLFSEPKTVVTDANGEATFNDVEPGQHKLKFEYKGEEVEKAINLLNDNQHYKIDVEVLVQEQGYLGMPFWGWALILAFIFVIGFMFFLLRRKS